MIFMKYVVVIYVVENMLKKKSWHWRKENEETKEKQIQTFDCVISKDSKLLYYLVVFNTLKIY